MRRSGSWFRRSSRKSYSIKLDARLMISVQASSARTQKPARLQRSFCVPIHSVVRHVYMYIQNTHVYTCTYAYTSTYIYTYTYMYAYMYINIQIYTHTHTYSYTYTHIYTCVHTHVYMCMYAGIYIYVYTFYRCVHTSGKPEVSKFRTLTLP